MKLSLVSFLVLGPYVLGLTPADSSYDEYSFGLGGGQYATYDCAGYAHPNSMVDGGIRVTHKFEAPFRLGLNTSISSFNGVTRVFPYPDLALDFKYISFGTTGLRVGLEDGPYGEIAVGDQIPLFSGRGFIRMGMGMKLGTDTRLWLGANQIPYRNPAAACQIDFPISGNQFLFLNGRYGTTGGVAEYGYSIGTRMRIP